MCNKVTSLKHKDVKEFCSNAATAAKSPGEFWRTMKPLLSNSWASKQSDIILAENGRVIVAPSEVAEVFTDHLSHVVQVDDSLKSEDFADHPSAKLIKKRQSMDSFNFAPVDSNYVRGILDNLNLRKAVG